MSLGLNATNSGGFKVDNLFVPQGYSMSREHLRDVQLAGPLYKYPAQWPVLGRLLRGRAGHSARDAGRLRRARLEKKPRLAKVSLRDSHLVQFQIGEAEARLRSARGYVETTAQRVYDAVVASGKLTIAQRMDIRMAATFAIHEAKSVADTAWEIAGANAIFTSGPFERRMRDLRTLLQQAQGRKAHLQDAGAFLLGLEANLAFA